MKVLPISAIVPTRNRTEAFRAALTSLEGQQLLPAELIVIDASDDQSTRKMLDQFTLRVSRSCVVRWARAQLRGAAVQRNQGMTMASQSVIWFFDDDIVFESDCVARLWDALQSDPMLGGVNAMIVNQQYQSPGRVSRILFEFLSGQRKPTYAGMVLGPAVNLLPEDKSDLPEVVPVNWLNTTCTLYRRNALPSPPFDSVFKDYSLMEDVALSLRVGQIWRLANARTARIFHDSQPGSHKSDVAARTAMELFNRYYIMTQILGQRRFKDHLYLAVWEIFQLSICAVRAQTRPHFVEMFRGKLRALAQIRARQT